MAAELVVHKITLLFIAIFLNSSLQLCKMLVQAFEGGSGQWLNFFVSNVQDLGVCPLGVLGKVEVVLRGFGKLFHSLLQKQHLAHESLVQDVLNGAVAGQLQKSELVVPTLKGVFLQVQSLECVKDLG